MKLATWTNKLVCLSMTIRITQV